MFKNHPILHDIELNFCDSNGEAVDTILIAGENGTGKSTIIETLYKIVNGTIDFEVFLEVELNGIVYNFEYYKKNIEGEEYIWITDNEGLDTMPRDNGFENKCQWNGILSDVDINFNSQNINSITSMKLDDVSKSRRSDKYFPQMIKQLFVDIQYLDDADIATAYKRMKDNGEDTNQIIFEERIARFTKAFNMMFDSLSYSNVENKDNHKEIYFKKNKNKIPIDQLSSGEKQVIFRGCFLLKDSNALNGTFVFIDEPEISLHPVWQEKILDYYKNIFSDNLGVQSSQIFVVTHSPFVIHNKRRKNDKVIILAYNDDGDIEVSDKAEYYQCNSLEVVEDAFNIKNFEVNLKKDISTVYLEGRTDEKYFNKALDVFDYTNMPFIFKWVGHMDENGQEANTGKDSLNKAAQFMISLNSPVKNICLFDCDTNHKLSETNNVICKTIAYYDNSKGMKKGIENALVLDEINLTNYYSKKEKHGDYGDTNTIVQFDKMKCCDGICDMDEIVLNKVFSNLRIEIDALLNIFK